MVQKVTLPNGVRILTEEIPSVRSVAIGIWVRVGSRDESDSNCGVSHFIEHMMFKGTKNRTAKELAEALDAVGGQLNAFTSKEYTCYYAKVLDENFDLAVDVLSDMFFNSVFKEIEIEKEKKVILEEIKMYEDTPDDQVHDLIVSKILAGHSLGRPIIGTKEVVNSLTREDIMSFMSSHYVPGNTVVAIAGNVTKEAVAKVEKHFEHWQGPEYNRSFQSVKNHAGLLTKKKDIEQVHLCLGLPGLPMNHPESYVLHVLNSILGGGISSRLFQTIREEQGLAYSVYSYHSSYQDTGLFGVYAGLSRDNLEVVLTSVLRELVKFKQEGISEDELSRAKAQLKGNLFLSLENPSSIMSRLGKGELCLGKVLTPNQVVEKITAVTINQIKELSGKLFQKELLAVSTIGPSRDDELIQEVIANSEL